MYKDSARDTFNSLWPVTHHLNALLEKGFLPGWSNSLATGYNIFSMIGVTDPFTYIYMLFPLYVMPFIFPYVAILKILMAGSLFFVYLRKLRLSEMSCLSGGLMYAFSGHMIAYGQHYYASSLNIYTAFTLIALEYFLLKEKTWAFPLAVAMIAVYSPFYLWSFSVYLGIYGIFRFYLLRMDEKESLFRFILRCAGFYLLGLGISAILFFPQIYVLRQCTRVHHNIFVFPFSRASMTYYISLFFRIFTDDALRTSMTYYGHEDYYSSPFLYSSILTIVLIIQSFYTFGKRERKLYGSILAMFSVFLLFPYFSSALSGFSFVYYRWTYFVILFNIMLAVTCLDYVENDGKKEFFRTGRYLFYIICLWLCFILYGATSLDWMESEISNSALHLIKVIVFYVIYCLLLGKLGGSSSKFMVKALIVLVLWSELVLSSYISVNAGRTLLDAGDIENKSFNDSTRAAVQYCRNIDKGYFRIQKGFGESLNEPLIQEFNGLSTYMPVINPHYIEFLRMIGGIGGRTTSNIKSVGGEETRNEILWSLLGVKYYFTKEKSDVPSGFEFLARLDELYIFKNRYSKPFITGTTKVVATENMKGFNVSELAFLALDHHMGDKLRLDFLEECSKDCLERKILNYRNYSSDLTLTHLRSLYGSRARKLDDQKLKLLTICEKPVFLIDIPESDKRNVQVDFEFSSLWTVWMNFTYTDKETGRQKQDRRICSGGKKEKITLEYSNTRSGTLKIEIWKRWAVPYAKIDGTYMDNFRISYFDYNLESFEEVRKNWNDNVSFHLESIKQDEVKGVLEVCRDNQLISFQIPYDSGWELKINGRVHDVLKVSKGFIGTALGKGKYSFELTYRVPWLYTGCLVSSLSILMLAVMRFLPSRRKSLLPG